MKVLWYDIFESIESHGSTKYLCGDENRGIKRLL